MQTLRPVLASLAASALLCWADSAAADLAPPPGHVETCTVERQQREGESCAACSTYFAEAERCADELGGKGMTKRCATRGASTWTEVWCKPADGASAVQPISAEGSEAPRASASPATAENAAPGPQPVRPNACGCEVAGSRSSGQGHAWSLALAVTALAFAARRPRSLRARRRPGAA